MKTYFHGFISSTSTAVALGNFDGVHLGHTALINKLVSFGIPSLVYTFYEHPLNFFKGEGSVKVINTHSEKESIFEALGVDILFYEDFLRVKDMTPKEFVKNILIDTLHAKEVVCGFNYRFGKGNTGDAKLLRTLLLEHSVKLTVVDEIKLDNVSVSSSEIRKNLLVGDIQKVNKMLGRSYFVKSCVKHGKALGRTLGFPTINLEFEEKRLVPSYGVYIAQCNNYPAVVNVGVRPTVDREGEPTLEAHIIGFDGDLYGKEVKVEFLKKLRNEKKFENIEELKKQVLSDIESCKKYFLER